MNDAFSVISVVSKCGSSNSRINRYSSSNNVLAGLRSGNMLEPCSLAFRLEKSINIGRTVSGEQADTAIVAS